MWNREPRLGALIVRWRLVPRPSFCLLLQASTLHSWTPSVRAPLQLPAALAPPAEFAPLVAGRMMLTSESYRLMTRQLVALADELCEGR